jgi:hypothetical protein
MAFGPDPKEAVSFEKLLTSQVFSQEPLDRLLVEEGILTKEEFYEMVKGVGQEIKSRRSGGS